MKPIVYFDHDADIGILGRGATIEDAFISAATAVFKIMTDISLVKPLYAVEISFQENDNELALVIWLNLLISKAAEKKLIFAKFELSRSNSNWFGHAYGDVWQEAYTRGTEVKGATLTMLRVAKNNQHWIAQCVVDV